MSFAVWFLLHAMLEIEYEQLLAHLGIAFGNPQNGVPNPDLAQACMRALGPKGEGVVAVRGMKDYESLRGRLLQLAHKLALLPHAQRLKILKVVDFFIRLRIIQNNTSVNVVVRIPNPMISNDGYLLIVPFVSVQEHGLGTDVSMKAPDRPVSSFAAQIQFGSAPGKTLLKKHASVGSFCDSFCARGIEQFATMGLQIPANCSPEVLVQGADPS